MSDSITTRNIHSNRELGFQTHSDTPSGMNNNSQIGWRSVIMGGDVEVQDDLVDITTFNDNIGSITVSAVD